MIIHIEGSYDDATKKYGAKVDGAPGVFFSHDDFLVCVINVQAAFLAYLSEKMLCKESGVHPTLCFIIHEPTLPAPNPEQPKNSDPA